MNQLFSLRRGHHPHSPESFLSSTWDVVKRELGFVIIHLFSAQSRSCTPVTLSSHARSFFPPACTFVNGMATGQRIKRWVNMDGLIGMLVEVRALRKRKRWAAQGQHMNMMASCNFHCTSSSSYMNWRGPYIWSLLLPPQPAEMRHLHLPVFFNLCYDIFLLLYLIEKK